MVLRLSKLFLRTLREDPADAEVASHRLLVRAGYIRRAAPGIYTWLPLGLSVLRKVEQVIREEMTAIGAQEVHFPALLPKEPYEATNRWTEYGEGIFRLKDRKGNDYLLAPTHEEMFTLLVKDLYSSYKDLPLSIYQIQNKYRDEARPRAGLLRGREFIMKDSYSFDVDDAGLDDSYAAHRGAYLKIFERLGLEVDSGCCHRRCHGRVQERGIPAPHRDRRGHLRALGRRLRGQRRGRHHRGPRGHRLQQRPGRRSPGHPGHPHHRNPRGRRQRPGSAHRGRRRRLDRRRHAQERRPRRDAAHRRTPDRRHRPARRPRRRPQARRSEHRVLPADCRRDHARSRQRGRPQEAAPDRQGLPRPRHVPGRAAAGQRGRRKAALPRGSPRRQRLRLGHRRQRGRQARLRPRRRTRLRLGRRHRVHRGARRRRGARRFRSRSKPPAASKWATSSSWAGSTPRPWT